MNSIDHVLLASLDLVFAQDPEGRFIYINEVTARAFGSDRHLLIGQHLIHTDLPPDIIQQLSADHHEIFTSSRPTRGELNLPMFYQDTVKDYEYTFSPVQGRQGTTEAAVFIAKDITERKRAEMALQASEAKYRSLFEAASDIILILDASDYQILNANWAAARKLGYSRQELLLLSIHGIEAQVDEARRVQIIERLEVSGEIIYEDSYRRKNGSTFPVEISAQLIEYEEQLCLQCFVRDITERKRVEKALQQQQQQIESVATNVPGVIYRAMLHLDGRISLSYISQGEECLSGYSSAEMMENPQLLLESIYPEDRLFIAEQLEFYQRSLQPWDLEYRILNRQGKIIWVRDIARFSRNEVDDVVVDGVVLDISDRKAAQLALERQLGQERLLRQVIEQIHQSLDLQTILQTAAEMTLTHLQVERVFISRFNPDWSTIIQVQAVSHADLTIVNPNLISSPCVAGHYIEWYQQGQIMYTADIYHADYSPAFLEFLAQYQVRSHLAVPIMMPHIQTDDQTTWLWGLLIAHQCSQPREWQPDEIELMKQLATQTGIAIHQSELHHRLQVELQERTRAEAEVRTLNAELEQRVIERTFALQFANQDLEREIKNRIQYEETLRRYERIVSATQDAISLVDRNYIYQVVNRTYCNKYQREIEEIIGHSVVELLGNDTFEQVVRPYLDRCLAGEVVQYEAWFNYVTIGPCYMSVSYSPYLEQDGSISGVVASIRDITALKQTEEALAESERKLRKLMDAVPGVIYEYRKAVDGVEGFTAISQGIEALYEISSEEALSNVQLMEAIVVDADRPRLRAEIDRSAQELDRWTLEFQIQTPQGNLKWVLGRAVLHQANDGDIIWNGILLDVSDRKQAEEALRQSERRYATLTENAPVGIFRFDASGQCVYVNPSWCRMTGRSPGEGYGDAWVQILHPEDRDRLLSSWAQAFAQKSAFRNEGRHLLPDGRINWFDCQMVPETDEQGNLTGYIGIVSDITTRKQAELALQASEARYRQSEERFRLLFENAPIGIVVLEPPDFTLKYTNLFFQNLLGYTAEELEVMSYEDFTHPNDIVIEAPLIQQCRECDRTYYQLEKRYIRKDQLEIWVNLVVVAVKSNIGEIQLCICIVEDITAQKRSETARQIAEDALLQAEARQRTILEAIPDLISLFSADGTLLDVVRNEPTLNLTSKPKQFIGRNLMEILPQDLAIRQVQGIQRALATRELQIFEQQIRMNNHTRYEEVRIIPVDHNTTLRIVRDISDRKTLEESLRRSQITLKDILDNIDISIVRFCIFSRHQVEIEFVSAGCEAVFGYTADEMMNNPTLWLSRIVPEDLEMVVQPSWQRVCEVGTDMIVYRFRHKNNQICYIKSRVIAYRDDVQDCWFITALETVSLH